METPINQKDALGFKQGLWEEYWDNGNLYYKGSWLDGKQTGLWEHYWHNSGNLMCKGSFFNDKKTGIWEWYDIEGNLIRVIYHH